MWKCSLLIIFSMDYFLYSWCFMSFGHTSFLRSYTKPCIVERYCYWLSFFQLIEIILRFDQYSILYNKKDRNFNIHHRIWYLWQSKFQKICTCNYYFFQYKLAFHDVMFVNSLVFFFFFVHISTSLSWDFVHISFFFLVFVNFETFFQTDDVRSDSSDVTRESSDWNAVCELVIDVFSARFADYDINIYLF